MFCFRTQGDVAVLIAGPAVLICGECALLCADIVHRDTKPENVSLASDRPSQDNPNEACHRLYDTLGAMLSGGASPGRLDAARRAYEAAGDVLRMPSAPSSRKEEDAIHDWIPFSKRARYEAIITAARSVVAHVKRPPYDGGVAGLAHADLCEALAALDADWPKDWPATDGSGHSGGET